MYFETLEQLKHYTESLTFLEGDELLILVGDQYAEKVDSLINYCNEKSIKMFGGIYPGLLNGTEYKRHGFIVQKHTSVYTSLVLPYLMRCSLDMTQFQNATALVLVDGLSSQMKVLTNTIFKKLGQSVKYIGGGAGFYDLQHRPCLFNNDGLFKDALIVSIIDNDMIIDVDHGWNRLEGPFRVTDSLDNVLKELDGENAFEVYKHVIEEESNIALSKEDFFVFAKDHPFGIVNGNGNDIVRDPIALNENYEIVCVADIPYDSEVYILKGNIDTLLSSSIEVSMRCAKKRFPRNIPLLFNCISRAMFMEDRFEEELSNIQKFIDEKVEGALSIGEISSLKNGSLEIHNKSTVLGLVEQ